EKGAPPRRHRVGAAQRQPVASDGLDLLRRDRVPAAELLEVGAERRPFALPAAYADVDVVALRKHPAVAAGDDGALQLGSRPVAIVGDDLVGHIALERHAEDVVAAEVELPPYDAVDTVGANEDGSVDPLSVDTYGHAAFVRGHVRDPNALP